MASLRRQRTRLSKKGDLSSRHSIIKFSLFGPTSSIRTLFLMDQFYTSSITSSIQFYPFQRRRRGGKRARAVPWVVPWLSRGLSHGCPRGCPAGCPVVVPWVVPRLSRGGPPGVPWFRIRAHRHMNVCLAVSICMREHTLKCAQTCKHGNSEKPPNTCSPDVV